MRIFGFVLPEKKVFKYALRAIYGIGSHRAEIICKKMGLEPFVRVNELNDSHAVQVTKIIEECEFIIGSDLQRYENGRIKELQANGSFRGIRHLDSLPLRGQRTKSNAKSARRRKKVL